MRFSLHSPLHQRLLLRLLVLLEAYDLALLSLAGLEGGAVPGVPGGQFLPEIEHTVKFSNSRLFVEGGGVLVTVQGLGLGELATSAPTFPAVSALGDAGSAGLVSVIGCRIVQSY